MDKMDSMTSSSSEARGRYPRSRGFTLTELMIATSLGSIILTGVLTTFIMLGGSGVRVSNYSMMESQTRRAFEQLGMDSRMANLLVSNFTGNQITSFTLTVPRSDNNENFSRQVTYGYDTSNSSNKKLFMVPGNNPSATTGRLNLVSNVTALTFLRYNTTSNLIPASTTSDAGVKHIQISISVSRSGVGVASATQVIRSSAFTLRNATQ